MSSRVGRVVQVAVTVAIVAWIASALGRETWNAIRAVDLGTLGAAVVLFASAQVFGGLRLAALVADRRVMSGEAIVTTWIGYFMSTFLPSTVGGDVVRALRLQGCGIPLAHAAGALLVDRLLNLIVTVLILCASAGTLAVAGVREAEVNAIGIMVAGLGCLGIAAILLWRWPALRARISPAAKPLIGIIRKPSRLLWTITLSFLNVGVAIVAQWILARRLGITLTFAELAGMICAVTLIVLLPVSVNGIGLQEGSFIVLLRQVGTGFETALAFALLSRVLIVAAGVIGGLVMVWDRLVAPSDGRGQ